MQGRIAGLVPAIAFQVLVWSCSTHAQTRLDASAKPPLEPGTPPAGRMIEEVQPSVIHLRDKKGNLVPVPGFLLEDFERMLRREHQGRQADQAPRFTLHAMTANGVARADCAELSVQFRYTAHEEGWVRIPLRLDQAVLRGEAQYKGSGQQFVHFEPGGAGYVCWVRGAPGQIQQLAMDVLVPLATVGEETRLRLSVPRIAVSELKLTVPVTGAVGRVSEGAALAAASPAGNGQTVLTASGLVGDCELAWRKPSTAPTQPRTVLEATGNILAKVGGQGIDCEVRLTVRGYGDPFDTFRVRLPKGAELAPASPTGYSLVRVASGGTGDPDRKTFEVRLAQKTSGPVEVQFGTRLSYQSAGTAGWCDVAAHEVVGATRQWGHVALVAGPPGQVVFGPLDRVRRVEEPPEPLRREGVLAAFEYYGQPCSLPVRVVEAKSRVSVEPEYRLLVDADRVTLKGKLRYRIRAAEIGVLDLELPGWQLEDGGPDNLIAFDAVTGQTGRVSLPLMRRPIGPVEVTIQASREIAADAKSLVLELPRALGDLRAPATIAILPADNVELAPTPKALVGLIPQQAAPSMDLWADRADRQQEPLYYRGEPGKAVFAADFRVCPQKIQVSATSQIDLDPQKAQVRQTLAYTVAHRRQDHLTLEIPRSLAGPKQMEVSVDKRPHVPMDLPGPIKPPNPAGPVRKQLRLSPGCLGSCEVVVQYTVDLKGLSANSNILATIPLVVPVEGELTGNTVVVTAKEGLRVQIPRGRWTPSEAPGPQGPQRRSLQWAATERTADFPLRVFMEEYLSSGSTFVQRAWVQSWLTGPLRQDRAVFGIAGDAKTVELIVPAGVHPKDVRLRVDGKQSSAPVTPDGRLMVSLGGGSSAGLRQLEVIYQFSDSRPSPGSMSLELPRLGGGVLAYRTLWQLILPRHEHLLVPPTEFTPEYHWSWNGLVWGRKSVLERTHLETWSGARHLAEFAADTNRYLFSTLGTAEKCELRTASRAVLVLGASGLVLVAGLVLIYVPAVRHPVALLASAVLLGAAAVRYPEPALLASQAASFGAVLAIFAGWLRRIVGGADRGGLLRQPAGAVPGKDSTQRGPAVPALRGDAAAEDDLAESQAPIADPRP